MTKKPRLFRYCELATPGLVAVLDKANNLLRIDRAYYDLLTDLDQQRVINARSDEVRVEHPHGRATRLVFVDAAEAA